MTNTPFGRQRAGTLARVIQFTVALTAIAVTVAVVRSLTRHPAESTVAAMPDSLHMGPGPAAVRPVSLSAADQQRIGVTFATAGVGPLQREIRTVAQVVYDETRSPSRSMAGWNTST